MGAPDLLESLADGRFVSGEALARRLGVSRAAVWKRVDQLRARGFRIDAVRGRGYRLHGGIPLLDAEAIRARLLLPVKQRLGAIEVVRETTSTNAELLARAPSDLPAVLLADLQTAGRGRRGNAWQAPFSGALCLSLAWPFKQSPRGYGGIGLVAGIAVAEALQRAGYEAVRLKWPNDLVIGGSKLGGLLVESRGEAGGVARAVIGLGINWRVPAGGLAAPVEQAWTDLASQPGVLPDRALLAALILNALVVALETFEREGFAAFLPRWQALDALNRREVVVKLDAEQVTGVATGIDDDGALLVRTADGPRRFTAGEVSVRGLR